MAFGWRKVFFGRSGPAFWSLVVFSLMMTAIGGFLFLLAGRRFVVGAPVRAFLLFLTAIGASGFSYFVLQ